MVSEDMRDPRSARRRDPSGLVVGGSLPRQSTAVWRRVEALVEWLLRRTVWQWLLLLVIVGYSVVMTRISLQIHHDFGTAPYDLGIFEQGTWLLSRFEEPFVTLRGVHLFGDHTSFVLLLVVPVYWVAPTTGTLLGIQSVAIAAGAIPVFLYARRRLEREWAALVLAMVYLLHPTVSGANLEQQFRPEAFLPVFVGFVLYGALEGKWRLYWVFVVLTLLVKEDVALILVPIGLWVALRRDRRSGIATMVVGAAYSLIAFFVIVRLRHFSGGLDTLYAGRIPFGGPGGFLGTVFTDPGAVLGHLFSGRRPWYLVQLTAPFAWVFLRRPAIAATGLAVVGMNLVVEGNALTLFQGHHKIHSHYSLVLVAPLAMGTVNALAAMGRHWRRWVGVVAVAALVTSFLWSSLPRSGEDAIPYVPFGPSQAAAARDALALIPDDAIVGADWALAPHLARRRHVYFLPNPYYTRLYGAHDPFYGPGDDPPPGTRLPITDQLEYVVMGPATFWHLPEHSDAWEREKGAFELVFSNQYYEVYRRSSGSST